MDFVLRRECGWLTVVELSNVRFEQAGVRRGRDFIPHVNPCRVSANPRLSRVHTTAGRTDLHTSNSRAENSGSKLTDRKPKP
jgi:hypothetical protein